MAAESEQRVLSTLVSLDETIAQIGKMVALGRDVVEGDEFLPLAAQQLGVRLGHDVAALPEGWRAKYPDIPWSAIRALRNRLAHDYHEIDFEILWDVFSRDVPALQTALSEDLELAKGARETTRDAEGDRQ